MGTNDLYATCFLDVYARQPRRVAADARAQSQSDQRYRHTGDQVLDQYVQRIIPLPIPSIIILWIEATLYYQGKNAFDFNSGFHIGGVSPTPPS